MGIKRKYTLSESSFLRDAARGIGGIGSEFEDHGQVMRVVKFGKARIPRGQKDKVIDFIAESVPQPKAKKRAH